MNALAALKARNAIIIAPHPRTARTSALAVRLMREGYEQVGAPPDLVQIVDAPSRAKTGELMKQADLVVATGGEAMVKAAYSSGTPVFGVGNAVHVVDETGYLDDAAAMIARAKTLDFATSCLADNALVAHDSMTWISRLLDAKPCRSVMRRCSRGTGQSRGGSPALRECRPSAVYPYAMAGQLCRGLGSRR